MPIRGIEMRATTRVGGATAAAAAAAFRCAAWAGSGVAGALGDAEGDGGADRIAGQERLGLPAGRPVAGRTGTLGAAVGVVTTAALALWMVVVLASAPMVILVSAAGAAAPVGSTDSCSVITEPTGSFGSPSLAP